jgi:uncharacterized protein
MQFEEAENYIINKLKTELPAHLTYHNANHTIDVYNASAYIAAQENTTENEMKLLLTAALYHDSGFLKCSKDHEEESCRIAKNVLPGFGYSADNIELICGMIMATRLPQSPGNLLEQILADADLDYLGRDDYFTVAKKLYNELHFTTMLTDEKKWDEMQIQFMQNHQYFTKSAVNSRGAKKEANMQQIQIQLINYTHK